VSVIAFGGSKNGSIFNISFLFDGKVNLVGELRMSTFKILRSFQKHGKTPPKNNQGKTEIFKQNHFQFKFFLNILIIFQI